MMLTYVRISSWWSRRGFPALAARSAVQAASAEVAHLGLDGRHLLGRENARDQAPMHRVPRRILEDEDPGRELRARLDELEDVRPRVAEGLPVGEPALHVVGAAHGVE